MNKLRINQLINNRSHPKSSVVIPPYSFAYSTTKVVSKHPIIVTQHYRNCIRSRKHTWFTVSLSLQTQMRHLSQPRPLSGKGPANAIHDVTERRNVIKPNYHIPDNWWF